MRSNRKTGYYGSPYDVGNYASHYDRTEYNHEGQRLTSTPQEQVVGKCDHRGKGPRGYHRSDERILEDVNDHLYLDPYIDATDIEVQVDKHQVILSGTVANRDAKRLAEEIADSIPGVENVENRIRVTKTHLVGPTRSNAREELK
jgi:osmotically-inducible protein OsmY